MPALKTIKVLIADDHDVMRRGIVNVLTDDRRWDICEARNGKEAIEKCRVFQPDVCIMDASMPITDGITAAKEIRRINSCKIVFLSVDRSDVLVHMALEAGVSAFVCKTDPASELLRALNAAASGASYFSPLVLDRVLEMRAPRRACAASYKLTDRETDILRLIADGEHTREIAKILNLSPKTVETHRVNMMKKLQIHNTPELVRYAIRNRIITA